MFSQAQKSCSHQLQCTTAGIASAAMLAFKQSVSLQLLESLFVHFEMRAQQHIESFVVLKLAPRAVANGYDALLRFSQTSAKGN